MLRITGKSYSHCDGIRRREFLTAGACGLFGLTLADLLCVESAAGISNSHKAVINVHLDGGPPQLDTIDPKPDAPVEFRGDFQAIATRIPGLAVCELLPQTAAAADKYVFIRSLVGSAGDHNAFQCQSGYSDKELQSLGGRPAMGSVVTKLKGSAHDSAPAFVDLMQGRPFVRNSARAGFLGPAYQAFRPDISRLFARELEPAMKGELARRGLDHATSLTLDATLSADRLGDRRTLSVALDRLRRDIDSSGMMDALDRFDQQAVGILTSGRFAEAMDLSRESSRTLDRFTPRMVLEGKQSYTSEGPDSAKKFLLARRLVEAGVRCVSISISDFDTHSDNFPRMRYLLPLVDHGLNALVADLDERNLLDDVVIVVWGEFGRTPRIDAKTGGRHHWPQVGPALLAGGGLRSGQVIGQTDRTASSVTARPVTYKDVFATLFHALGIDAVHSTIMDPQGRPQYIIDGGELIREALA